MRAQSFQRSFKAGNGNQPVKVFEQLGLAKPAHFAGPQGQAKHTAPSSSMTTIERLDYCGKKVAGARYGGQSNQGKKTKSVTRPKTGVANSKTSSYQPGRPSQPEEDQRRTEFQNFQRHCRQI